MRKPFNERLDDAEVALAETNARLVAVDGKLDRVLRHVERGPRIDPDARRTPAYYLRCLDGWTVRVMEDTRVRAAAVAMLVVLLNALAERIPGLGAALEAADTPALERDVSHEAEVAP